MTNPTDKESEEMKKINRNVLDEKLFRVVSVPQLTSMETALNGHGILC